MSESAAIDRVSLLFVQSASVASQEEAAASAWLGELPDIDVQRVAIDALADALVGAGKTTVWFHNTRAPVVQGALRSVLDAHVRGGGGLLATLAAATLPVQLGWEAVEPDEATVATWSEEPEDEPARSFTAPSFVRGLQSFRGHPLFDGLGTGTYTWAPHSGEPYWRYAYTGDRWPKAGRVIGVQKSFIAMNPERRLAWEYMLGDGWAVCIGGYVYFAARDRRFRPHLARLVRNALRRITPDRVRVYLLGGSWRPADRGLSLDSRVAVPAILGTVAGGDDRDGFRLSRPGTAAPFTLAGSRVALVGREREGIDEVWFHPFRAVSRWKLEAVAPGGTPTEVVYPVRFEVRPGGVSRRFDVAGATVDERTGVARESAAFFVRLAAEGSATRLRWTMETDMRLMWPYPPEATGRLTYAVAGGAVGLLSEAGEWLGVQIEPAPAVLSVDNIGDDDRSRVRISAELDLAAPTQIVVVGSTREEIQPERLSAAMFETGWEGDDRGGGEGLTLTCGDAELEEAIRWACARLATYRVLVPGLGASLVAGYASSRSTPFGDGRPGYAWYFGRDACWTGLASLAVGQFERVCEVLEFLARHQDITGKILHECTTSGVVHYDAADSTPLYLLLAARYFAWTGDSQTLERLWPSIVRAHAFCCSTDSDGDGLIENTGVGHGWVEFGRLGGHHVSLYLAGVWVAALDDLEVAARALGRDEFADALARQGAAARASLELSFYDPIEARYANGRRGDGSLDMAETVMTAVPLALGAVRAERCASWLDRVEGEDFTAPWGVRMVPCSDPDYRADGYHTGAVWPLYTGWVSLAEYKAGRHESAYRHWTETARLYRRHALGAWPEALHGDEPRSLGVTSDQAWSTAMAVLPLVEGLLGVRPRASAARLEIQPQIPEEWYGGEVRGLRVGASRVSIGWRGAGRRVGPAIDVQTAGASLAVTGATVRSPRSEPGPPTLPPPRKTER
jgi:glycogen debranching enzyme